MRKLLSILLVTLLLMLAVIPSLSAQEATPTIADMIAAMATDPEEPEFTMLYAALQAADPAVLENLA